MLKEEGNKEFKYIKKSIAIYKHIKGFHCRLMGQPIVINM